MAIRAFPHGGSLTVLHAYICKTHPSPRTHMQTCTYTCALTHIPLSQALLAVRLTLSLGQKAEDSGSPSGREEGAWSWGPHLCQSAFTP